MGQLNLDPEFERGYWVAIQKSADDLIAEDIEEEGAWEDALRSEVDQYGWYVSTNQSYNTLLASKSHNALMERVGYEDMDIFELISRAASYAIEGDIVDRLGGDFESYREECDAERERNTEDAIEFNREYGG